MTRGRLLGGMERLFFQQNTVGSCNMCSILFYEGRIDLKTLPGALQELQKAFPLLTARIASDPFLRFEETNDRIPYCVVKRDHEEHWRYLVRSEVRRQYNEGRIFITIVEGEEKGEILVAVDHTVVDAKSLYVVCQYLIAAMHGRPLAYVPVGDCWEKRVTREYRSFRGLIRKFKFIRKIFNRAPRQSLSFGKDALTQRVESFGIQFDKSTVARIKAQADHHNTNLNAFFCAAAMLESFALFSETSSGVACLNTPVSTRDMIVPPAPPVEMGMFLSTLLQWHALDRSTDIWELSRNISQTIRNERIAGDPIALGLLAKGPMRPTPPKPDKFRQRLAQSLTVSNPGRLDSFEDLPNARIVAYRNLGSLWPQESITVVVLGYGDFLCIDGEISVERLGHIPNAAEGLAKGIQRRALLAIQ